MAFSYTFEENFELGTLGGFNSESDTDSRLDFPHYSTLARIPRLEVPFRGAYCMRVALANDGTPADAYVQEDEGFDIASDGTLLIRFYFYLSSDTVMADSDSFIILALQSAGPVNEVVVTVNYSTAAGFVLGIGETAGTSTKPLTLGVWHCMELFVNLDNAGNNDGSIDAWLDGASFTQVASLDQAAIVQARLGVLSQDAGTTAGTLLFDQVVTDSARVFPIVDRFPDQLLLTKTSHVFVGAGTIRNAQLLSGAGTDCVLTLYDTDVAYTSADTAVVAELKNTTNSALVDPDQPPLYFRRGCFATLAGTTPRAILHIGPSQTWGSVGRIRHHGLARRPDPIMG